MKTDKELEFHPMADVFPLIGELLDNGALASRDRQPQEWADFVMDIRTKGQQEPIWLYEGKILDGRNRYLALRSIGRPVEYREYEGDDPLTFVLSLNLQRRHLTKSQRAVVALNLLPFYEAEAKAKQKQRMTENNPRADNFVEANEDERTRTEMEWDSSAGRAAKAVGVGFTAVRFAKKVAKAAPEELEKVKRGKLTVSAAYSKVKAREQEEREAAMKKVEVERNAAVLAVAELTAALERLDRSRPHPTEKGKRIPSLIDAVNKSKWATLLTEKQVVAFLKTTRRILDKIPTEAPND